MKPIIPSGDAGDDMMSSDKTNSAGHENTSATIPGQYKERIGACDGSNMLSKEKDDLGV